LKKLTRQIAISDIHGCVKTFKKLVLDKIELSKKDTLYLLGDYINKGPNSKGVIDFIFSLQEAGYQVKCLRGNHEQYLIDALQFSWEEIAFKNRGGRETLASFNANTVHDIPAKYLDFLKSLSFYIELEKYLLIHAGLNFDLTDPFKDDFSMLNIRNMEVAPERIGNRIIIHGHVPTTYQDIEASLRPENHHICIDAGCVYHHIHALNHLVALELNSQKLHIQKNIDYP